MLEIFSCSDFSGLEDCRIAYAQQLRSILESCSTIRFVVLWVDARYAQIICQLCEFLWCMQVFDIKPWKSWSAVVTSIVSFAASLWLISVVPWYLLPVAWFLSGTAFTGVSCSRIPCTCTQLLSICCQTTETKGSVAVTTTLQKRIVFNLLFPLVCWVSWVGFTASCLQARHESNAVLLCCISAGKPAHVSKQIDLATNDACCGISVPGLCLCVQPCHAGHASCQASYAPVAQAAAAGAWHRM